MTAETMAASAIKVGDRIKDNDPRMPNRILTVREFDGDRVIAYIADGRHRRYGETRIALARIYGDDKPRRTGWSLVR